jgi:hypothetical protein
MIRGIADMYCVLERKIHFAGNMVDVLYPIKITPFISLDNDSSFPFAD